jgi:hypothetical protein
LANNNNNLLGQQQLAWPTTTTTTLANKSNNNNNPDNNNTQTIAKAVNSRRQSNDNGNDNGNQNDNRKAKYRNGILARTHASIHVFSGRFLHFFFILSLARAHCVKTWSQRKSQRILFFFQWTFYLAL